MTTAEVINKLKSAGFPNLTMWKIRGFIDRGELPAPRTNSSLKWDWTDADLNRLRKVAEKRRKMLLNSL